MPTRRGRLCAWVSRCTGRTHCFPTLVTPGKVFGSSYDLSTLFGCECGACRVGCFRCRICFRCKRCVQCGTRLKPAISIYNATKQQSSGVQWCARRDSRRLSIREKDGGTDGNTDTILTISSSLSVKLYALPGHIRFIPYTDTRYCICSMTMSMTDEDDSPETSKISDHLRVRPIVAEP